MPAQAIQETKLANIRLLTDPRVFGVMAALHAAGFQEETEGQGRPIVRDRLHEWIGDLDKDLSYKLRTFYKSHRPRSQTFQDNPQAAYVSLALWLGSPPKFELLGGSAEIPEDVWVVRKFSDLVREFWKEANLTELWEILEPLYLTELKSYRALFEDVVTSTLGYFRVPMRVSLAKEIILTVDLLEINDMVNARNLERTYFLVVGPSEDPSRNRRQLEHEYLHFLLDDLIQKFGAPLLKRDSLVYLAQRQPNTQYEYKNQFLLVTTESLIEAIQTRLDPPENPEELDRQMVRFFRRGLILTPYFYRSLENYDQLEELTLPSYLETVIENIQEGAVRKDAKVIGELEKRHRSEDKTLQEATRKEEAGIQRHNEYVRQFNAASELLGEGKFEEAQALLQGLRKSRPHNGKILFYLGQVAFQLKDYDAALEYYRQCNDSPGLEAWILGWSRVRLGRILASRGDYSGARELFVEVQSMEGNLRGANDEANRLLVKLP